MNIGIINYESGNIFSVFNTIYNLGYTPKIINETKDFKNIDRLIVPGVGSAFLCIKNLKKKKIFNLLKDNLNTEIPILGICLGLQIFCKNLNENGISEGLSHIDADVKKINNLSSFNIGWSKIKFTDKNLISNFSSNNDFYFCHSFSVQNYIEKEKKFIIGYTLFNKIEIPSIIKKNNFIGVQFHPEKSQNNGVKFLEYFLNKKI